MSYAGMIIGIPGLEPELLDFIVEQRFINTVQHHAMHFQIAPGF